MSNPRGGPRGGGMGKQCRGVIQVRFRDRVGGKEYLDAEGDLGAMRSLFSAFNSQWCQNFSKQPNL